MFFFYSEISNCEADISFFVGRHHADTGQWLFDNFLNWFSDPGDSRAYVLLGDAGVGKSVMAGVLAQRTRKAGHLGAAYFCCHITRKDPRDLLLSIASQLCQCHSEYNNIVRGQGGVRMLANSKLGVLGLFNKLLQEPLGMCTPCEQRKLVIIDALDETEYESREDFLDLLMHRFPRLPKWLVFFITSRPEDTVQSRLKKYNPCIKICAGNAECVDFYRQHEQDIRRFLEKKIDFSCLPYSVEDVMKKCNGLFLYAFYIVELLSDRVHAGKIGNLSDLFPGNIDEFFRKNFQRVFDKVGADLYGKLFSCVLATPSPLPFSFISFFLKRENSKLDEQEVIDAVSQFVVRRDSDETFTFLHNLIPSWLTDRKKAPRRLFIDRVKAGEFLRNIILEFLPAVVTGESEKYLFVEADFLDYVLRVGVHILCGYDEKDSLDVVFSCLTDYNFIQKRIQKSRIEIYSVIGDFKLSARCQALGNEKKVILVEICRALESNAHVLVECPHLLPSCLRSASEAVQRNVTISAGVSTTWMEWNQIPYPVCEIPRGMDCFALSPDKTLLAGGKGRCISLFDACSLKRVLGPVELVETKTTTLRHLAFSPDNRFVFFGRLDKWFSVERGCVHEMSHFSGNASFYEWGCFTLDGRYIIVKDGHPIAEGGSRYGGHRLSCLLNVCCLWATCEIDQIRNVEMICSCAPQNLFGIVEVLEHSPVKTSFLFNVARDLLSVLATKRVSDWRQVVGMLLSTMAVESVCDDCREIERKHEISTLALARQRIIDLYHVIFKDQVWDLQSGRPVFEEVFSSGVELSPGLYLCHLTAALERCEALFSDIEKSLSLCNVALINAVFYMYLSGRVYRVPFLSYRRPYESFWYSSFFLENLPTDFQNYTVRDTRGERLSPDGKWMAVRKMFDLDDRAVMLFENRNQQYQRFEYEEPVYVIRKVKNFAFSYSGNIFVFVSEGKSLNVWSLQTGTILSSVSGFTPLYYTPGQQVGYVFSAKHEEKIIPVSDFPISLLTDFSLPLDKAPIGVTCTSERNVLSLWTNTTLESWKIMADDTSFTFLNEFPLSDPSSRPPMFHVTKGAFSRHGGLIATFQGISILLFHFRSLLCVVCEEEREFNVSFLTFSTDSTLLLYGIESSNNYARVYVWDVQKREVQASFGPPRMSVDCCCLSSDNSKLVICGEMSVEVWEYAGRLCRQLVKLELGRPYVYSEFEKFSHCTVSSDDELLACCIADSILVYPLRTPAQQSFRRLPLGHLGKIEFSQFLKGTIYLISYGVDGAVFLWDLSEWRAVAYARIANGEESIISMAVSPEEDKVVCLTSCNRLTMVKLHGLKSSTMPLQFPPVTGTGRQDMTEASRGQLGEQPAAAFQSAAVSDNGDIVEDIDVGKLLEEMNFVLSSDEGEEGEEGDDKESDELHTDE